VVAVVGLSRRTGVTTVARALGVELARRSPGGSSAVTAASLAASGIPLSTTAARRLSRSLARLTRDQVRPLGRICLTDLERDGLPELVAAIRPVAPLVIDVESPEGAATAAACADAVVLVAAPHNEPAVVPVVSSALSDVGPQPIVVLNRDVGDLGRWDAQTKMALPDARLAAQMALAGRASGGAYGRAIAELADCLDGPA